MKTPLIYLSKVVLPPLNALVAHSLKKRGLSEGKIASLLGLTQPAINLYLKRDESEYLKKLTQIGLPKNFVRELIDRVSLAMEGGGIEEATRAYLELLGSGLLCEHHRALTGLPESCDVCMRLFGSGGREEREGLILRVKDALKLLERSSKFVNLLPEVRSNFVARLDKAVTEEDVVGIPGRMTEVRGKVRAFHPPEFGASRHMARVLLEVSKKFPSIRAAINLRYDEEIGRCIKGLGWKCVRGRIEEEDMKEEDPVLVALRRAIARVREPVDAFFHDAFYGLEASLYVFAEDSMQLAEKVIALANFCFRTSSSSSS